MAHPNSRPNHRRRAHRKVMAQAWKDSEPARLAQVACCPHKHDDGMQAWFPTTEARNEHRQAAHRA